MGLSIVYAIKYNDDPYDMLEDVLIRPFKYAGWLYKNVILYGNNYKKYSYDEFTI